MCAGSSFTVSKYLHVLRSSYFLILDSNEIFPVVVNAILSTPFFDTDQYLTHYWPISNGQMVDEVGSAHMMQGNLTSFIEDKCGSPNSALALNGGWTQVPSGIYFDTPEYTISLWVYPLNVSNWARIFDFGNGHNADNIVFALSFMDTENPAIQTFDKSTLKVETHTNQKLDVSHWQFLTATFNGTNTLIYINGQQKSNHFMANYSLSSIFRTNCYIGKSNWASIGYSWSYLDDLRFYNKSLTQSEIIQIMNQNGTGRNLILF